MKVSKNRAQSLTRKRRICDQQDFDAFRQLSQFNQFKQFNQSKKHHSSKQNNHCLTSRYFQIFYKPTRSDDSSIKIPARMAVIVSKKVSKKAVRRVRIKRIVREVFRKLPLFGLDFLIIAKIQSNQASNSELIHHRMVKYS